MARARLVLLIGSPRSGTTWLQSMLGAHGAIATPQETDLFRLYLEPLAEAWDSQLGNLRTHGDGATRRVKGLPAVFSQEQFDRLARHFVETMIDEVNAWKPGAEVVLEKSPGHSMSTDVVQRFWPEASFIHLIRDGRDVAASLVAASHSWGEAFAPKDVAVAAHLWRTRVEAARRAVSAPGGYTELRYEDLHANGPVTLQRAFTACGIAVDLEHCARLLEEFAFEAQREAGAIAPSILTGGEVGDGARSEPAGFFRKGSVGSWRSEWGAAQRAAFAQHAGELLVELGYEPDSRWAGSAATALQARGRVLRGGAKTLRKAAGWLERRARD
jgi:hypothetical protein